ncbi:MAG: electron transfer flavoprotein subunit beta/FixA family protein [Candidatus Cloacimonetes bacterium]|nr:electron transfer flavoprotein subunit beta/FixA family protein [Candidatus Cloacimonadota bacterium]MCF7814968.1 electron transfer flavoprotein subunit beta/FixA family protein [Candidatus Cloacimonadota bacterium]MCF7868429.1 electron transfer flavoprotein subunit beta/FixA family protein [Candidatus Cloacimonadota bacterium]MCF7883902.1 electron transfer flavoprotein subunit beta/FixA family protein [Candidatus Cloacimonadota bacterium]
MNIIVCIKQVPDTNEIKIDPETNTLIREGVESIINPFDLYAIEEALRLKEKHGGKVTAISMGPPQVEKALRDSVSLGVDEILLLTDRKFAGADSWATSLVLAEAIRKIGNYDLILFGQQAIDGDTAQVGPGVASHLGITQTGFVREIEEIAEGKMIVQRLMEDGYDRIKVSLPAALTVVKDINVPRLPSLRGKRNAKKAELKTMNADDLELNENDVGLNGSPTQVVKIFSPEMNKEVEKHDLPAEELAEILYNKLKELGK